MTHEMVAVLMRYYRSMSRETAAELVTELRDTRSLQSLAGYRVARAVSASTPPNDLAG